MGAHVVTIRGRHVTGVRATLSVLGLDTKRIGRRSRIIMSCYPVSLGHLTVEGGQLPQPRRVLPVLGMALPIDMIHQVIGLIDPRGLDIPRIRDVVTPLSPHVASFSSCIPSHGILASSIADRVARVRAHRASIFAGYRADLVQRQVSGAGRTRLKGRRVQPANHHAPSSPAARGRTVTRSSSRAPRTKSRSRPTATGGTRQRRRRGVR